MFLDVAGEVALFADEILLVGLGVFDSAIDECGSLLEFGLIDRFFDVREKLSFGNLVKIGDGLISGGIIGKGAEDVDGLFGRMGIVFDAI